MERTLLAFLFYFQPFRNGRLFSYPKSKGERENMNKLVKRLLTGTLAFATILTALPVTAVHASGNQYWTESAERVGYIEHVMNDGSIKSTLSSDTFWSPQTTHYNLQLFQEKSTIASQRHDHASFPAFYQLNAWLLIAANITSASITFLSI